MVPIEEELLQHQYIYVPWVEEKPIYGVAVPLALHLRSAHNARLTVVCPGKSNAPDALAKFPIVTERSGAVSDGGVVLAYCPTYKLMRKISQLSRSVVALVEWPTESHGGWAKLTGAYNIATRTVMSAGLTSAGHEALKGIVFEGYNGWNDDIAERATIRRLQELSDLDLCDREVVLAYARRKRGENGIRRLYVILDKFDAARHEGDADPHGR